MISRHVAASLVMALSLGAAATEPVGAKPWDEGQPGNGIGKEFRARPFVFVGTAEQCGGVAGTDIVTSAWLGGLGLADDAATPTPPPVGARRDPRTGLLLNKNGPTADCSAAGAIIEGFKSGTPISELGYDYRVGGHCGAGAPRFNITTTAGFTYFVGCAAGTHTPAPQDPQWNRVRFGAADVFPQFVTNPAFLFGTTPVRSILIIFDEGTDVPTPSDPTGVGLATIDNIDINGQLITKGKGIAPRNDGKLRSGREEAED